MPWKPGGTRRDGDRGDRGAGEVMRIEDHEIGGRGHNVDDVADQPAFILRGAGMRRHEDEFAGHPPGAKIMRLAAPGAEIMLEEARVADKARVALRGQGKRVGEAVGLAGAAFVRTRKILRRVINQGAGDLAGGGIDLEACKGAVGGVRAVIAVGKHVLADGGVYDHLAVLGLVGIGGVENVIGVGLAPDDLVAIAFAGKEADAGVMFGVSTIQRRIAADQGRH